MRAIRSYPVEVVLVLSFLLIGAIQCLSAFPTNGQSASQKAWFHHKSNSSSRSASPHTYAKSPPATSPVVTTTITTPPVQQSSPSTTAPAVPVVVPTTTISSTTTTAPPASPLTGSTYDHRWDAVAVCEEGGWGHYGFPAYPNSLGITAANWYGNGGGSDLSPAAQVAVGERVVAKYATPGWVPDQNGCSAW